MDALERKIVHDAVAGMTGVQSGSRGEDPNRFVVICTGRRLNHAALRPPYPSGVFHVKHRARSRLLEALGLRHLRHADRPARGLRSPPASSTPSRGDGGSLRRRPAVRPPHRRRPPRRAPARRAASGAGPGLRRRAPRGAARDRRRAPGVDTWWSPDGSARRSWSWSSASSGLANVTVLARNAERGRSDGSTVVAARAFVPQRRTWDAAEALLLGREGALLVWVGAGFVADDAIQKRPRCVS